jgi:hypothetical protein
MITIHDNNRSQTSVVARHTHTHTLAAVNRLREDTKENVGERERDLILLLTSDCSDHTKGFAQGDSSISETGRAGLAICSKMTTRPKEVHG